MSKNNIGVLDQYGPEHFEVLTPLHDLKWLKSSFVPVFHNMWRLLHWRPRSLRLVYLSGANGTWEPFFTWTVTIQSPRVA